MKPVHLHIRIIESSNIYCCRCIYIYIQIYIYIILYNYVYIYNYAYVCIMCVICVDLKTCTCCISMYLLNITHLSPSRPSPVAWIRMAASRRLRCRCRVKMPRTKAWIRAAALCRWRIRRRPWRKPRITWGNHGELGCTGEDT